MRHSPDPAAPQCPDCGAAHYPAGLGSGKMVWCNGTPAHRQRDPAADARARSLADSEHAEWLENRANKRAQVSADILRRFERARQSVTLRAEHAARMSRQLPKMISKPVPDSFPDTL